MRKALLLATALAVVAFPAFAADAAPKKNAVIVYKAPAAPAPLPCTSTYCVGPYLGAGVSESGGSFDIPSLGLSGLASNNVNMFVEGGYDYLSGNFYAGINGLASYGLSANGTLPGGGNSALWGVGGWVKLGYNVALAFGITPPTSGPSLAGLVASTVPYVNLGIWDRPWGDGFLTGVGAEGWLQNNISIHVDWNHVNFNNANINPIAKNQTEDMVLGGLDYHF
jgi:hypothetical protein